VIRIAGYERDYRNIHFERRGGCLMLRLHTDGGALKWGATAGSIHGQLGEAFRQIARDESVRVLILTGTGESFCSEMNLAELPTSAGVNDWIRLAREGYDLMMKFLDIEVPVIAAVNGPAYIHSQLPLLADIVLASATAEFADLAHFVHGVVPGDGVHVVWPMLLGINRARHFLMTGQRLTAQRACDLGVVAEVLPAEKLLDRAWDLAADLERKPAAALRNTRLALTHPIKKRLLEELDHGLALESVAALSHRTDRN
jgi:enoyl-CoA hydratase/carnithine racemase